MTGVGSRPSGLGMTLLGVVFAFLIVLGPTLSFLPVMECPNCNGTGEVAESANREYVWLCGKCGSKGKIPLL